MIDLWDTFYFDELLTSNRMHSMMIYLDNTSKSSRRSDTGHWGVEVAHTHKAIESAASMFSR